MDIENQYGTLEIQKSLLALLRSFHNFCQENNVKYSLVYGSLLGAIRHQGFIPWDDDVDVIVYRDEFQKIVDCVNNSDLEMVYRTDESLWLPRVIYKGKEHETGNRPLIDIFILDKVPNSWLLSRFKYFSIMLIQGMIKSHPPVSRLSISWKILSVGSWLMGRFFTRKFKYKMFDVVAKIGDKGNSGYLHSYNTIFPYRKHTIRKELISSYTTVPFDGIEVSIMSGYDEFLTTLYGDYMTPPDEKKPKHR